MWITIIYFISNKNKRILTTTTTTNQPDTNQQQNQQQQQHADSTQKLVVLYERYLKLNEYNIRSQNFWDSNEHQISEVDYLNGLSLIIYFCYSFVCKRFMIAGKWFFSLKTWKIIPNYENLEISRFHKN